MNDESKPKEFRRLTITILANVIAIILAVFSSWLWTEQIKVGDENKITSDLQTKFIKVQERTIKDLSSLLNECSSEAKKLTMENYLLKSQLKYAISDVPNKSIQPPPSTSTSSNGAFQQYIKDKNEIPYHGNIDISQWPEIGGRSLVFNRKTFPLDNIQSICFSVIKNDTYVILTTIDGNIHREIVKPDFFKNRPIMIEGVVTATFNPQDVNCLIFSEIDN